MSGPRSQRDPGWRRRSAPAWARWLRPRTLFWVALAALVVAGRLAPDGCSPASPAGAWTALDGDTLRAPDGTRVRLPGVDTPEQGRPFADEARALAAAFVAPAGVADLSPSAPRDRYDRALAEVRRDGRRLSAELIRAGLAWVYEDADAELRELQAEAVRARRGVHAGIDDWAGEPLMVTSQRFHLRDCPALRSSAAGRPLDADLAGLLMGGRSPCRTCLPWPPRGSRPIGH